MNNNLGLASYENKHGLFEAKIGLTKLQKSETFIAASKNEMARYFSNFGNKLQMMVGIGKECDVVLHRILISRNHLLHEKPCGVYSLICD